jgi:hypothetical protein
VIRQFDLATGNELAAVTVQSGANLHYFAQRAGQLYVAGLDAQKVFRLDVAADDSLTLAGDLPAANPASIAFSESGREMFVSGHRTSSIVARYDLVTGGDASDGGDSWLATTDILAGSSLGGVAMLPIR